MKRVLVTSMAVVLVGVLPASAVTVNIDVDVDPNVDLANVQPGDVIPYRVNVEVSLFDNQGLHLLGFDVRTDTGVPQSQLRLAEGEFDGFTIDGALWDQFKGIPFFNGGWGADNAGLPTGGNPQDDDVLGAGTSLGLTWDADINDNPADGYQPIRRPGIGQGEFLGWNGGAGDPWDDPKWPPGDFDGLPIRDGFDGDGFSEWTWMVGEIRAPDVPGTYHVDFVPVAANVIKAGIDLQIDWPNDQGTWIQQLNFQTGDDVVTGDSFQFTVIPEPATLSLLGLAGLALIRRR